MIDAAEIVRRAKALSLRPDHVWKDYVLNHILAAVVDSSADFVFRGGTALARAYWPDFRLSEDLDFITEGDASGAKEVLARAVDIASASTGFSLAIEFARPRNDWARSLIDWDDQRLVVDVNGRERASMVPQRRRLELPYSDLQADREILVLRLEEILGNKWYMLDDREEPRDLFDIWSGLCRFDAPFADLATGHKAKYSALPQASKIERARRLKRLWEIRLDYQVADLPGFEETYRAVRQKFDDWHAEKTDSGP
jgi:predicted nucleotidyltransferase component of viral defense system